MILEPDETAPQPMRCTIVVDASLPAGRAANAAAVIALTIGQRHPHLVGPELIDESGHAYPGLIPIGIAVLAAPRPELDAVGVKALKEGVDVVIFPTQGQETTDYVAFRARVREAPSTSLSHVGIGLYGRRKAVGRLVGRFPLLK